MARPAVVLGGSSLRFSRKKHELCDGGVFELFHLHLLLPAAWDDVRIVAVRRLRSKGLEPGAGPLTQQPLHGIGLR